MTVRRGNAIVALVVVALLAAALAGALARAAASASSSSPSPAAGGVTLRIGWTADPDNLNPFIGVETAASEVLALTYDRLFGIGTRRLADPAACDRAPDHRERRHLGRRQDVDGTPQAGRQVAGRRAPHRR